MTIRAATSVRTNTLTPTDDPLGLPADAIRSSRGHPPTLRQHDVLLAQSTQERRS